LSLAFCSVERELRAGRKERADSKRWRSNRICVALIRALKTWFHFRRGAVLRTADRAGGDSSSSNF